MHQVLMLNVPDVSSPSHVAPSVPATFDINRRSRRNDRLEPMRGAGSRPQVQVRGDVGYGCTIWQRGKRQAHYYCQNGETELHGRSPFVVRVSTLILSRQVMRLSGLRRVGS